MNNKEVMQMALDAIEAALSDDQPYISRSKETVEALRSRLAQPEKEWVGLTDKEILADDVLRYHFALNGGAGPISKKGLAIIAAVNAKLKEKNN